MPGYSGTPLPKKLGIRPGARVLLAGAPPDFDRELVPWPEGAKLLRRVGDDLDVIVLFVKRESDLHIRFGRLEPRMVPDGGFWVAWPKKTSGVTTDLGFDRVQAVGLEAGLVDNKICAVTDVWSGLRFVVPKEKRAQR